MTAKGIAAIKSPRSPGDMFAACSPPFSQAFNARFLTRDPARQTIRNGAGYTIEAEPAPSAGGFFFARYGREPAGYKTLRGKKAGGASIP